MTFLGLTILLAVLDWYAVAREKRRLGYFTKPGVMLALIAWMWVAADLPSIPFQFVSRGLLWWFVIGLGFSLLGDVLLMLPREKFLGGLVSFLLAHLAFIQGLDAYPPPSYAYWPYGILAVLVFLVGLRIILRLGRALAVGEKNKLILPVALYTLVISVMLFSALTALVNRVWFSQWAILVSAGGLLFYISDLLLAWNRFVEKIPNARLKVRITYHLGQIALIVASTFRYLTNT